jgi:MFS family permease
MFRTAVAGASLALILIGLARKADLAIAGLIVFGLFLFLIYPALQSFVGNAVSPRNQAQAFSFVSNLSMISGALISLLAGILSDSLGISSPFIVMGLLGLGIFFFSALYPGASGAQQRTEATIS